MTVPVLDIDLLFKILNIKSSNDSYNCSTIDRQFNQKHTNAMNIPEDEELPPPPPVRYTSGYVRSLSALAFSLLIFSPQYTLLIPLTTDCNGL